MGERVNLFHTFSAYGEGLLRDDGTLWIKFVRGFDPRKRGSKCLVGDYCANVHEQMYTHGDGRDLALPKLPFDFMFLFFGKNPADPDALTVGFKESPFRDASVDSPNKKWRMVLTRAEALAASPIIIGSLDLDEETRACPFYRFGWDQYGSFGAGFQRRKGDTGLFG